MTPEQIKIIEQIRPAQTKGNAHALNAISMAINGPQHDGCFCSATHWKAFYNSFFSWYDEQQNTLTK